MNLVIDIGNTRIKAAVFDGKKLIACHIIKSFKKSFFSGLGTVIILLQILVSFLNIFFIAIFFKKEILEFLKKNNLDKIIIITGIIVLILPINFFIKICLFCSIYVLVEFMQIISRTRKKQDNNSIIIILLSTILGLFLIISFFTNSLI